jgi:hypothetical protein
LANFKNQDNQIGAFVLSTSRHRSQESRIPVLGSDPVCLDSGALFRQDPRPLGAPEWAVSAMQSMIGLSEPAARAVATISLRAAGVGMIGVLLALALSQVRLAVAAPADFIGSMLLAIASLWSNFGYFPIFIQVPLALASVVIGSLAGLALRRITKALVVLAVFSAGLFVRGTSTGISDDLHEAARATGQYVLENAASAPDGDDGFAELRRRAFLFAEDNSHGTDPVAPNKAAILALGVILGEEKVADEAGRPIDIGLRPEIKALYRRITVRGRNDLSRHFWVSAALAVLSDEDRSMAVGITKELMDATPGGSGFSFVDLTADRAGTLFTAAATRNAESARDLQIKIRQGVGIADVFPEIGGLPEGISRDDFQNQYGGLGGTETGRVVEEIQRRLAKCRILDSRNQGWRLTRAFSRITMFRSPPVFASGWLKKWASSSTSGRRAFRSSLARKRSW